MEMGRQETAKWEKFETVIMRNWYVIIWVYGRFIGWERKECV